MGVGNSAPFGAQDGWSPRSLSELFAYPFSRDVPTLPTPIHVYRGHLEIKTSKTVVLFSYLARGHKNKKRHTYSTKRHASTNSASFNFDLDIIS